MKKTLTTFILLGSFYSLFGQEKREVINDLHNIMSVKIFSATVVGDLSGPGIGLSYERLFKNSNKIGLHLPFYYHFGDSDSRYNYDNNYNEKGFFTMAPTLKIYPFGYNRNISWSVGPGLRYANGKVRKNTYTYDDNYNVTQTSYVIENRNYFGVEIHNGLNINVDKFYFGISGNLGLIYNYRPGGIANFDATIGLRF